MEQQVMAATADPAPAPTALAPGFRFHPTDEELVRYYLRRKACGKPFRFEAVSEIDVYKSEPWELAEYSALNTRDQEWYFFSPLDRKYCNGSRLNRATGTGYWKATGKVRPVRHRNETIGMKKTLVFYGGRAPEGRRTDWVMHEYRLTDAELGRAEVVQDAFVLCRIFHKSDLGDRYAPFVDEDWDDEEDIVVPGGEAEDELPNDEEARNGGNGIDQENHSLSMVPLQIKNPDESQNLLFPYKRKISEDPESSLAQSKGSKQFYPSSSCANASEDSMTTTQEHQTVTVTATSSLAPMGFPLVEPKESQQVNPFDSSNLEKSVPPGYLKLISDLENGIVNVSMEREALKIEVMRAQAMINYLQSRIDSLTEENAHLRRLI